VANNILRSVDGDGGIVRLRHPEIEV